MNSLQTLRRDIIVTPLIGAGSPVHVSNTIYIEILNPSDIIIPIGTCRRIVDDGVKENGFSIITENRTYHVIAESTNDWK